MKNCALITTTCLLLVSACRDAPKSSSATSSTFTAPGASGVGTSESLRPCDGHDFPFLVAMEGATYNPDFPGLHRRPVLVAYPDVKPLGISKTDWTDSGGGNWSQDLGTMNALSLGLDWLSFKEDKDSASGEVMSWSPDIPPAGFAALYFLQAGAVWVYAWGPKLSDIFPVDYSSLNKTETELHTAGDMEPPIGGHLKGIDLNGGFNGAWATKAKCFLPPGAMPDEEQATLFYSVSGGQLFTSHAAYGVVAPATTPSWSWTAGTEVEFVLETTAGEFDVITGDTELTAFSYDREHRLVMYSTDDPKEAPFMVANATESLDASGTVIKLALTNVAPLLNHVGDLMGESLTHRPSGSCGFDPQRFLGERGMPNPLQAR